MNRYETLKDYFFTHIEEQCHGIYKQKALLHSIQVSTLCQKLALEHHLDVELAGIIGLFHDYIQFTQHSSFQHGLRCSEWISSILSEFHDDAYSEILKDADVLAQYFAETDIVLSDEGQKRLKKYLPEKI